MNKLSLIMIGSILAGLSSITVAADKDGYVPLFNGKNLDNWQCYPKKSMKGWSVKDGIIYGDGDNGHGYLAYHKKYTDFELKFSYRFPPELNKPGKANSGVDVRARIDTTGKRALQSYHADIGGVGIGPQILGAWDFHTPGRKEHRCFLGDSLVISEKDKPTLTTIKDGLTVEDIHEGEWNDVHLIIKGNHFQFFINGKLASEFTENLPKNKRLKSGWITLQTHDPGMVVLFKDIRIKELH